MASSFKRTNQIVVGGIGNSGQEFKGYFLKSAHLGSVHTHEHTSITVSGGHYQQWLEDISCGGACGSTQISYYMMKM